MQLTSDLFHPPLISSVSNQVCPVGSVVQISHLFATLASSANAPSDTNDWQLFSYTGPPFPTVAPGLSVEQAGFSKLQYFDIFSDSGSLVFHAVDFTNPIPLTPGQVMGCYVVLNTSTLDQTFSVNVLTRGRTILV